MEKMIKKFIILEIILGFYFLNLVSTAVIPIKNEHLESRIVGGSSAKRGQFPYQIMIYKDDKKHCGGSILDANHIITAAHCVVKNDKILDPNIFVVKGGDVNLLSNEIQTFPVKKIYVPSNYKARTFDNDVAILKLTTSMNLEKGVLESVVLADQTVEDKTICVVSGWGTQRQNTTEMPDQLYYADVQVINRKICATRYELYNTVSTNMVCAGYDNGSKDACEGDSGGPLMCGNKLGGVVSWGVGCGLAEFPGVYTNIATQKAWIATILKKSDKLTK
ncbi:trypsin alpha-3-like [Chrysoperla carnea]|uniref:trypsin alpha-3-like n=1 Tax=Chrysoperla carnea TaxID=189513 RepID=UPI001D0854CC|nr:trypsin alpha-3-like [Chrysoperla carnea]